MAKPDASNFKTLLEPVSQVAILVPATPNFDQVAGALSLKLALETAKKRAYVICANPMVVEFNRLVGVNEIKNTFGSSNLVITFPGQTELVDKVSYNLEKGELQLVISPKPGVKELDSSKLKFITGTGKPDLIIVIGADKLSDLGSIYSENKNQFSTSSIIAISNKELKETFTVNQFVDAQAPAVSEIITYLLDVSGLTISQDIATNLLSGLDKATGGFSSGLATADTFEAAALLMRLGGSRQAEISAADFPDGSIPGVVPSPSPTPIPVSSGQLGFGTDGTQAEGEIDQPPVPKKAAPADWYEPKIYKGPTQPLL